MGIIWDITKAIKGAAKSVKNFFTINDDEPSTVETPQTLNQQVNTWTIKRMPTNNVGSFANNLNQTTPFSSQNGNILTSTDSVDNKDDMAENKSFKDKVKDWFSNAKQDVSNFFTRENAKSKMNEEYNKDKKHVFLWYNPILSSAYELKPKDEGAFNERLNMYIQEINDANTYEEQLAAQDRFINDVKWQFKSSRVAVRPEGSSPVWLGSNYVTKDKFTDDELETLKNNNIWSWDYDVTKEDILTYLSTISDNEQLSSNLSLKYKDDLNKYRNPKEADWDEEINEIVWNFRDKIFGDWTIEAKTKSVLNSEVVGAAIRNYNDIAQDFTNRALPSIEYLKKYADEAKETPELQRTQAQLDIIDAYNTAVKLFNQWAVNRKNYIMRELNEWVKDWNIVDALDRFEDWSSLNDVLTDWMFEISWLERSWPRWMDISDIDIIRKYTNEAVYNYKKATEWNVAKRVWNWLEHVEEPIWFALWEAGQQLTVWTINFFNMFTGKWQAATSAYLDSDFSVWKLIETDDGANMRTIKKYALQFLEYAPEWIANIIPDIALIAASWWGSAPLLLRKVWQLSKVSRLVKVQKAVEDARKAYQVVDKTLTWLEKVGRIWEELGNINTRWKRTINIADRILTQTAIWQHMDAQLSTFDTEPYSTTSFWLSIWWSLLWDILPEAKDLYWIFRNWTKWWKALTKWTWVWDLVDFISQSDENANAIASAMWKRKATFTEQELKDYVRTFAQVTDAAKVAYEWLSAEGKVAANQWTKELMYNYVKQNYWANSMVWKAVRDILVNKNTSPADIIKYTWSIPGIVEIWPYKSVIRLTHWTLAWVEAKGWWFYSAALDAVDGWFGDKVMRWFTYKDIQDLSKIKWYEDTFKNRDELFRKVESKAKDWSTIERWFLTEKWLDNFWLEAKNLTLDSLWISLSEAENVKEILKEKMAWLKWSKLSENTINELADGGWYNEVVKDVKNVLCD